MTITNTIASTFKKAINSTTKNQRTFLNSLLPEIRTELAIWLTQDLRGAEADICRHRIHRLFDYNIAGGKFARSSLACRTYQTLHPTASEQQLHNAGKVALTIEMLQTFLVIEDDIMDNGALRRGKPCWHTLNGVGLNAVNDGLLLDCGIDSIIRHSIPNHPRMQQILHDIYEAKQKTVLGQMLDMVTKDLNEFTWHRYSAIVEHKTSHYSFCLPINIGLHLADCTMPNHLKLRQIAYRLGHLFQAQDDYLDCFGDPLVIGKSNLTDLSEGKCTWVTCALVEKLAKKSPQKLSVFCENFGSQNEQKLKLARTIILEEEIDRQFEQYQDKIVDELRQDIANFPAESLRDVLAQTLEELSSRQK